MNLARRGTWVWGTPLARSRGEPLNSSRNVCCQSFILTTSQAILKNKSKNGVFTKRNANFLLPPSEPTFMGVKGRKICPSFCQLWPPLDGIVICADGQPTTGRLIKAFSRHSIVLLIFLGHKCLIIGDNKDEMKMLQGRVKKSNPPPRPVPLSYARLTFGMFDTIS